MARLKKKDCHCCNGSGQEYDRKAVGATIRGLRSNKKLTLTQVAKRMRISKPYLSDLERGFRNWRAELIENFTKAIND